MEKTFDAAAYIDRIGKRLVVDFGEARQATTPGLVGGAMEMPVRKQLEQILPRGIAVGSGCVIDSGGNTSQQIDVVLYERDICPVFSVNNTPETTYYPCEGVIAVGEIKSLLDTNGLADSFAKIASVKRLRRYIVTHPAPLPNGERVREYRYYGSKMGPATKSIGAFDQDNDEYSQIFGFALFGKLELKAQTLLEKFVDLVHKTGDTLSLNMVVTLNDGILYPYSQEENKAGKEPYEARFSAQTASHFIYCEENSGFRSLTRWIHFAYRSCKTSDSAAFDRYLIDSDLSVYPEFSMPKKG